MPYSNKSSSQSGFTLIELFCCMMILGILAVVAVPSFSKYLRKARSASAVIVLRQIYDGAFTRAASESSIGPDGQERTGGGVADSRSALKKIDIGDRAVAVRRAGEQGQVEALVKRGVGHRAGNSHGRRNPKGDGNADRRGINRIIQVPVLFFILMAGPLGLALYLLLRQFIGVNAENSTVPS